MGLIKKLFNYISYYYYSIRFYIAIKSFARHSNLVLRHGTARSIKHTFEQWKILINAMDMKNKDDLIAKADYVIREAEDFILRREGIKR